MTVGCLFLHSIFFFPWSANEEHDLMAVVTFEYSGCRGEISKLTFHSQPNTSAGRNRSNLYSLDKKYSVKNTSERYLYETSH